MCPEPDVQVYDLDIFVDAVSYMLNKRRHVYIKPLDFSTKMRAAA